MSDNRFPYLVRADGNTKLPAYYPNDSAKILAFCAAVESRTGTQAWFNKTTGRVHFCLGDPSVGVATARVMDRGVARIPPEDDVCSEIQRAKRPMRLKERDLENAAMADAHDAEESKQKIVGDMADAAKPRAKHDLNKAKMGRHSRPVVTVP